MEEHDYDFKSCILCQKQESENLIEDPASHARVLQCIEEWAKYGEVRFLEVWKQLKSVTVEELKAGGASWHRSCYRDAVHSGMLKRAKAR